MSRRDAPGASVSSYGTHLSFTCAASIGRPRTTALPSGDRRLPKAESAPASPAHQQKTHFLPKLPQSFSEPTPEAMTFEELQATIDT